MRAFPIDSTTFEYFNKPCVTCGQRTQVGDVVLVVSQGERSFVHRELVWHTGCVQAVLINAPVTRTELTNFRSRLVATVAATGLSPIEALLDD